jgi:outer membrane usher protein
VGSVGFESFGGGKRAIPLVSLSFALALCPGIANGDLSARESGSERSAAWFVPNVAFDSVEQIRSTFGVFQASFFSRHGTGIIRLMASGVTGDAKITRLETSWATELSEHETLRLGDAVNRAGAWGQALRFGGLQLGTNLGGEAVPATTPSWRVGPMNYDATDAVQFLSSDVPDGDPAVAQMKRQSFDLMGRGAVDRSLAIGFLRTHFGLDEDGYGPLFASALVRRGVSEDLTAELRSNVQRGVGNCGFAAGLRLPGLGVFTVATAASESRAGIGTLAQTGFEYRLASFVASIRSQWATAEFHHLGLPGESIPPRRWSVARARYDAKRYGAVEMAYATLASYDEPLNSAVEADYRVVVGKSSTLTLRASRTFASDPSVSIMLGMTLTLEHLARLMVAGARGDGAP